MSTPECLSQPPQQPDLSRSAQETEQDPYAFRTMGELIDWLAPSGMGRAITRRQQIGTKMVPPTKEDKMYARLDGPYEARATAQPDYGDVPIAYVLQTGAPGQVLYLSNTGRVVQLSTSDQKNDQYFIDRTSPGLQPHLTDEFNGTEDQFHEEVIQRLTQLGTITVIDGADQPEIIQQSLPRAIEFGKQELKRRAENKAKVQQHTLAAFANFRRSLSIPPDEPGTPPPPQE